MQNFWTKILIVFLLGILICGCNIDPFRLSKGENVDEKYTNKLNNKLSSETKLTEVSDDYIFTPTPVILPTLTESQMKLLSEKINSTKCTLPCFFDIIPGTTNWEEARKILLNNGANYLGYDFYEYGDSHRFTLIIGDDSINVILRKENDVINKILLKTSNNKKSKFSQIWSNYNIHNTIKQFGKPDKIYIFKDDEFLFYNIFFIYENKNIYLEWTGKVSKNKENFLCLDQKDDEAWNFNFFVSNPKNSTDFINDTNKEIKGKSEYGWRPILEALNINEEAFYSVMITNSSYCFDWNN